MVTYCSRGHQSSQSLVVREWVTWKAQTKWQRRAKYSPESVGIREWKEDGLCTLERTTYLPTTSLSVWIQTFWIRSRLGLANSANFCRKSASQGGEDKDKTCLIFMSTQYCRYKIKKMRVLSHFRFHSPPCPQTSFLHGAPSGPNSFNIRPHFTSVSNEGFVTEETQRLFYLQASMLMATKRSKVWGLSTARLDSLRWLLPYSCLVLNTMAFSIKVSWPSLSVKAVACVAPCLEVFTGSTRQAGCWNDCPKENVSDQALLKCAWMLK
jgi:hypothetical protein